MRKYSELHTFTQIFILKISVRFVFFLLKEGVIASIRIKTTTSTASSFAVNMHKTEVLRGRTANMPTQKGGRRAAQLGSSQEKAVWDESRCQS